MASFITETTQFKSKVSGTVTKSITQLYDACMHDDYIDDGVVIVVFDVIDDDGEDSCSQC